MVSFIPMKYILLFFVSIFIFFNSFGQNGSFVGTVKDKETQEPIIGAVVIVTGTDYGDQTDTGGNFRILNIKPGSYDISVQYLGQAFQCACF